ncbi:MAG: GNAT family N-acetyltransferase [Ginsengibacter sp.]
MITIRPATIDDAPLLSEMGAQTFYDTFNGTCTEEDMSQFLELYYNLPQVQKELNDSQDYYYLAFFSEMPAGYLRVKESNSDIPLVKLYRSIELKRIYVVKEFQSQKIGAALLNFAFDFATEKNYKAIYLSVWEHNSRALNFYKKWGFINTGHKNDFPIGNTPQTDYWLIKLFKSAKVDEAT